MLKDQYKRGWAEMLTPLFLLPFIAPILITVYLEYYPVEPEFVLQEKSVSSQREYSAKTIASVTIYQHWHLLFCDKCSTHDFPKCSQSVEVVGNMMEIENGGLTDQRSVVK